MSANYEMYTTAKSFTGIDPVWRKSVEKDISSGEFVKFTSANSAAKQVVIYLIDKNGMSPKVESLGCSMHRITMETGK